MTSFNEIVVMDAKPTPKASKHVLECVKKNQCLCGCGKPILKRGLAANCYYAWRRARLLLATKKDRAAYDARLIRMGRLLGEQVIRALKRKNVFDRVAEESASS